MEIQFEVVIQKRKRLDGKFQVVHRMSDGSERELAWGPEDYVDNWLEKHVTTNPAFTKSAPDHP